MTGFDSKEKIFQKMKNIKNSRNFIKVCIKFQKEVRLIKRHNSIKGSIKKTFKHIIFSIKLHSTKTTFVVIKSGRNTGLKIWILLKKQKDLFSFIRGTQKRNSNQNLCDWDIRTCISKILAASASVAFCRKCLLALF